MEQSEEQVIWKNLLAHLNKKFDGDLDIEAIIFLIGVQEYGKGYQKFKKDDKLNIMHIAICTLLEPYGYYEFLGRDKEGWPHWKINEELPMLKPMQQERLMKEAIIDYFRKEGEIT